MPSFPNFSVDRLSKTEVASLEVPFTKEEIFDTLFDLNGDKALRPYGFTFAFWQFSWDFVKDDFVGMFKEFHQQGRFILSLNSTFLVLIQKKGGGEDLKGFRPISLLGEHLQATSKGVG